MVRIVADYWENCKNYDDLIKRCFFHISRKFPNPEGSDDSFNTLMLQLSRMEIFNKFDVSRHNKGIVDKRFEQWMYVWIHHFLEEAYLKRRLHANRFKPTNFSKDFNKETVYEWRNHHRMDKWDNEKPYTPKDPSILKGKTKYIPTIDDLDDYITNQNEDPLSSIIAEETTSVVRKRLHSDRERKTYDLLLEGLKASDIAQAVGVTTSCVATYIKKIREACANLELQVA